LPEGASDILVTEIMLGVFGRVPAFDTFLRKALEFHLLAPRLFGDSPSSTGTAKR
jgi:hypothetical protein